MKALPVIIKPLNFLVALKTTHKNLVQLLSCNFMKKIFSFIPSFIPFIPSRLKTCIGIHN